MRVLLDEQLPRQLAAALVGYEVSTVQKEGWSGVRNGELLARAADRGFDVFLTKDQNLEFQQNVSESRLGIVVIDAPRHAMEVLRPLIASTLEAIRDVRPGEVKRVAV